MDLHQRGRTKREIAEVVALSLPVALGLALGTAAAGVITGSTHGWAKFIWACVLVVLAGLTAAVAWLRGSKSGGYKRAAARYARLVAGAGEPVVNALGDLCAAPAGCGQDDARVERLRSRVIDTLRVQCGTTGAETTRAAIYEFRGTRDLHMASWSGRRQAPRAVFREGDVPRGRDVVEFAASVDGRVDRVGDVLEGTPAPRGEVARDASYRSYLSTPISVAGKSWGLLTVDSPERNAFRETDEGSIALLAGVLAAGLAHAQVSPQATPGATVAK